MPTVAPAISPTAQPGGSIQLPRAPILDPKSMSGQECLILDDLDDWLQALEGLGTSKDRERLSYPKLELIRQAQVAASNMLVSVCFFRCFF